jgi:hypothetical protein
MRTKRWPLHSVFLTLGASTLGALTPGALPLAASQRIVYVPGGGSLETACAQPDSEGCTAALEQLARRAADDLLIVAQTGRAQFRGSARLAASMPIASLRSAGAAALGHLSAGPEDTALLAELLNDPVPMVRRSAHGALQVSSDPAARPLAQRVQESQSDGARPQPAPSAGELKVPIYAGARYLHFASSPREGQSEFSSADSHDKVAAFYSSKFGPPMTAEKFEEQGKLAKEQGKSAKSQGIPNMSSPEFQAQMKAAMDAQKAYGDAIAAGKSPQDAAQAMMNAMQKNEPASRSRIVSALHRKEIYGSPQLFVAEKGVTPSEPARLVAVYKDLLLGKTGIAVFTAPLTVPGDGK